jgi:DNA-directed RNA polymerase subunit RPC12/RpoP
VAKFRRRAPALRDPTYINHRSPSFTSQIRAPAQSPARHVASAGIARLPSSQLTKLQTARLLEWNLAGAITGVARSVEDALAILGFARPAMRDDQTVWICTGCHEYRWQSADAPARCPACGHTRFEREAARVSG